MLQTRPAAINQYCLPIGPTAAKSLHTAAGGKLDRQTPYRYTDTAAYDASSVVFAATSGGEQRLVAHQIGRCVRWYMDTPEVFSTEMVVQTGVLLT